MNIDIIRDYRQGRTENFDVNRLEKFDGLSSRFVYFVNILP